MSNFYDDSKFQVIQRKWFGLTKKYGGETAAGYTLGAEAATKQEPLVNWYPRGPIKVLKVGAFVLGTVSSTATSVDALPVYFTKGGVRKGTFNLTDNQAVKTLASTTTISEATVAAGGYIGFQLGTPETGDATDVVTGTTYGTVAFFVDYVPSFSVKTDGTDIGKWNT